MGMAVQAACDDQRMSFRCTPVGSRLTQSSHRVTYRLRSVLELLKQAQLMYRHVVAVLSSCRERDCQYLGADHVTEQAQRSVQPNTSPSLPSLLVCAKPRFVIA